MEYSEDPKVIHEWAPLLMLGRDRDEPVAATRALAGTDVDFGALTRALFDNLVDDGAELRLEHRGDRPQAPARRHLAHPVPARRRPGHAGDDRRAFVFVGAGGWALKLLQKAGIPEVRGYGLFPISGQWLRADDPALVAQHRAKVYGKARSAPRR